MSTCVAEIERSKKDTLKIICDGKSFFSASQNCSWQAYLVCHGGDMWAANGKRSKTSKTASFFSFWVNSRRSFTDGQSSKRMVNCIMSAVEVVKAPSACYSECPSKSAKIMVWPCFHIRYKRYEKASYYVIKVWLVLFCQEITAWNSHLCKMKTSAAIWYPLNFYWCILQPQSFNAWL